MDDEPLIDDPDYAALVARLEREGYRITDWLAAVPVQLRGFLPTGEAFYFRCRYRTCSLRVAPTDGEPVAHPAWRNEVSRWDEFGAGCIEAEEAEAVLRELLANYPGTRR